MYTNKGNLENYLMTDIGDSFNTQITAWINAAQIYIDNYTGKTEGFEEEVASAKYYDGNGLREIDIDDCTEVTAVEILEANSGDIEWSLTEGHENDYIVYPYNDTPIYRIKLVNTAEVGAFYNGKKRIKITAKWGYKSSIPADIVLAATILASSAIEPGLKGGKIKNESLGDYSVAFEMMEDSPNILSVNKILDNYKIFKL